MIYCKFILFQQIPVSTLYVLPKDSVLPVEDRAIAFPSVCFCVVFIKTLMLVQLFKKKVAALYI